MERGKQPAANLDLPQSGKGRDCRRLAAATAFAPPEIGAGGPAADAATSLSYSFNSGTLPSRRGGTP